MNSRDGVRGALLHTLPGRAIVVGLAIKLAVLLVNAVVGRVPAFLSVVETVAGLAVAAGLTYFLVRLFIIAKRRLLWRVRRKLMLSYFFVGFFPAGLLLLFSLLCAFLLFYNLSTYLVQNRLRGLADQARFLAHSTALEIQRAGDQDVATIAARRQAAAVGQYPDVSIAVVPVERSCSARASTPTVAKGPPVVTGPWTHVAAPRAVPAWVPCGGFSGVLAYSHRRIVASSDEDTHLLVRAVQFAEVPQPAFAVVVDILVNDSVRQQLRRETGVEIKSVAALLPAETKDAKPPATPLAGHDGGDEGSVASAIGSGVFGNLPSLMEYRDWTTGEAGTLTVTAGLDVAELYDRISAAEGSAGRTFVDHGIGARAVRRYRARAAGRLHAQDRGFERRPARRIGRVVQFDDRQHRRPPAPGG
jgi:hypothetical protein